MGCSCINTPVKEMDLFTSRSASETSLSGSLATSAASKLPVLEMLLLLLDLPPPKKLLMLQLPDLFVEELADGAVGAGLALREDEPLVLNIDEKSPGC